MLGKAPVKVAQNLLHRAFAVLDAVQLIFHLRREGIVHHVGLEKPAPFAGAVEQDGHGAHGGEQHKGFAQGIEGTDDGGIGGRTSDSLLLQKLD